MHYAAPTSIAEAAHLLADGAQTAHVLCGGTDLLVRMRGGGAPPGTIVDLKRIDALRKITRENGGFRIGAAVSSAEMAEYPALATAWPGVVEAAGLIGSTQIQARATVAGNLCNGSPAADAVPALVAADAVVRIASAQGLRDIPVAQVPVGPGKTSLSRGDFVASIFLPARPARAADAYLRFTPRSEMDIAVAGCAVALSLDATGHCTQARVALGAVAPAVLAPVEAAERLIGTRLDTATLAALCEICTRSARPISDKRGTAEFRRQVVGVLARRAARIAYDRALGAAAP